MSKLVARLNRLHAMADKRLSFLKQVASKRERKSEAAPAGGERRAFLRGFAQRAGGSGAQEIIPAVISSQSLKVVFSLESLLSFGTRCKVSTMGPSKEERKRPHYDNRLRRLNAQFKLRVARLGILMVLLSCGNNSLRHRMHGRDQKRLATLHDKTCPCSKGCFKEFLSQGDKMKQFIDHFWGLTKLQQDMYDLSSVIA